MKHKDAKGEDTPPAVTSQEAFDDVWSDKGWVLCDETGKKTTSADKAAAGSEGA